MTLADDSVEFFFIDTNPMVHEYHEVVWAVNKGSTIGMVHADWLFGKYLLQPVLCSANEKSLP